MEFYRVCHRTERNPYAGAGIHAGPYQGFYPEEFDDSIWLQRMHMRHCNPVTHPSLIVDVFERMRRNDTLCRDGIMGEHRDCGPWCRSYRASDYACGFTDLADLRRWFHGYRAGLARLGFVVRVFDVDAGDVLNGHLQAAARMAALDEAESSGRVKVRALR